MLPVVIIGLGRIGVGRDIDADSGLPNHLAAALSVGAFEVTGLVDGNALACTFVEQRYPSLASSIHQRLSDVPRRVGEIIVICAPAESHAEILMRALEREPRVVVIEKPVAPQFEEAKRMLDCSRWSDAEILVNFNRRFDPRHCQWRSASSAAPKMVTARYGKGLWNYASHIVDLLLDWYGPVVSVQALASERPRVKEPNLSFRCRMSCGFDAVVVGVDGVDYDLFEIDIYCETEKIEMRGGGGMIGRSAPVDGLYNRGYADLAESDRDIGKVGGFKELYEHIAVQLNANGPLSGCDLSVAVANAAILDAALVSAERGGISVKPQYR